MTKDEVMKALEEMGNPNTKKVLMKHGAEEPFFGVKVGDMKKIQKKVKKDHDLALELYDTGNADAMYLAALIADEKQVTKAQLNDWAKKAYWHMLSEYSVAWLAADSPHGFDLGLKWIESKNPKIAAAGWSALSNVAAVSPDEEIDVKVFGQLLKRIEKEIHDAPNRVRYTMNAFVIAIGSYIAELTSQAEKVAKKIGKVSVEMGGTACKVPLATDYIEKVKKMNRIGKKRKMARC